MALTTLATFLTLDPGTLRGLAEFMEMTEQQQAAWLTRIFIPGLYSGDGARTKQEISFTYGVPFPFTVAKDEDPSTTTQYYCTWKLCVTLEPSPPAQNTR